MNDMKPVFDDTDESDEAGLFVGNADMWAPT